MGLFEDIDLPPLTGPFSLEEDLGLAPLEAQAPPSHKWARQLLSADQFTLFQLGENGIIDLHQAEPVQEGSDGQPDMRVAIELVSFNIPSSVGIDEKGLSL